MMPYTTAAPRDNASIQVQAAIRSRINLPEVQRQLDQQAVLGLHVAVREKDAVIEKLRGWLTYIESDGLDYRECARKALSDEPVPEVFDFATQ